MTLVVVRKEGEEERREGEKRGEGKGVHFFSHIPYLCGKCLIPIGFEYPVEGNARM